MTIKTPNRFSAVSIVCTSASCPAAQALKGQRYLSAKAPRIPLADCASPATCACTYRKYPDRRVEERREGSSGLGRTNPQPERRRSRGRRSTDQ